MPIRRVNAAAFALALLIGCRQPAPPLPPGPDTVAIRAALEQRLTAAMALLQNKDAAGAAALFTPDAVWILPDGSTLTGTAAITAGYERFFAPLESLRTESVTIDRLLVVNDHEAVTFAHAIATLTMKGEKASERHFNPFADQWVRGADGVWRIAYEINADGPMADAK